jgi:hypothetical protein
MVVGAAFGQHPSSIPSSENLVIGDALEEPGGLRLRFALLLQKRREYNQRFLSSQHMERSRAKERALFQCVDADYVENVIRASSRIPCD